MEEYSEDESSLSSSCGSSYAHFVDECVNCDQPVDDNDPFTLRCENCYDVVFCSKTCEAEMHEEHRRQCYNVGSNDHEYLHAIISSLVPADHEMVLLGETIVGDLTFESDSSEFENNLVVGEENVGEEFDEEQEEDSYIEAAHDFILSYLMENDFNEQTMDLIELKLPGRGVAGQQKRAIRKTKRRVKRSIKKSKKTGKPRVAKTRATSKKAVKAKGKALAKTPQGKKILKQKRTKERAARRLKRKDKIKARKQKRTDRKAEKAKAKKEDPNKKPSLKKKLSTKYKNYKEKKAQKKAAKGGAAGATTTGSTGVTPIVAGTGGGRGKGNVVSGGGSKSAVATKQPKQQKAQKQAKDKNEKKKKVPLKKKIQNYLTKGKGFKKLLPKKNPLKGGTGGGGKKGLPSLPGGGGGGGGLGNIPYIPSSGGGGSTAPTYGGPTTVYVTPSAPKEKEKEEKEEEEEEYEYEDEDENEDGDEEVAPTGAAPLKELVADPFPLY